MTTKNTTILAVRVDKGIQEKIDALAKASGLDRSDYLRTLYLRELMKARPVGLGDGGAVGLSTLVNKVSTLAEAKTVNEVKTPLTLAVNKALTPKEVSTLAEEHKGTPWGWILLGVLALLVISQGQEVSQEPSPIARLGGYG